MSRRRNRWMAGITAGVLCLSMIGGCSRVPETKPEIDTSPPFYEPSGEEQTEPEGSMITSEPPAESTEGMEITLESGEQSRAEETEASETPEHTETSGETVLPELSSGELTSQDTGTHSTESAEVETTEAPEPEETATEAVKVPETGQADQPPTELESPTLPESTEGETETAAEAVPEEKTTESMEPEETEPVEVATEAPTESETEPVTRPTLEPETVPSTQSTEESEAEHATEAETSTERESEAEIVLQSIQIKANQSQYTEGWKLTKANLTVTLYYSDGFSGTLTNGYSIHQTGDQVYVTYGGVKSNTITVIYEKTLTSISIESKADQYEQGYQIISANLKVTLHYSDRSIETITHGYTIHQSGAMVYITYNGVTSNTITINYAAASRVEITPKGESYGLGDVITLNDFIVTAYQSDGSNQIVTDNLKLYYMGKEVTSVTLTEYDGDVYVMGAHSFKVAYKDVQSDTVRLNVRYEETGHLYREMLTLVNEARAQAGLPALVWDTEAEDEILIRAEELTRLYSHDRPDGSSKGELYAGFVGENIANGGYYSRTHVQDVFNAWMNSGGHRALILRNSSLATGFVCAYYIATDANGNQAAYTVMWVTSN